MQSMEFREHHVEYGQTYESSAIVSDGTSQLVPSDDIRLYVPSTRPGAPLPHAEVEDLDGRRLPLMSLVPPGEFLLIAGEDGDAWCDAARWVAETARIPLRAVRIGHLDGDYRDPRCTWLRHRQIGPRGAVLVRPDRFVGWRSLGASSDAASELRSALSRILCLESV
jgi:2,4-dichlorophenol 6-monooxygenase